MRVQASSGEPGGIGAYQPEYPVPQESANRPRSSSLPQATRAPAAAQPVSVQTKEADFNPAALPSDAPGLLASAVQREQLLQNSNARYCLEKLLKDYPGFEKGDEVIFRLARLLENASEGRDIRRAYDLYVRVQNDYPYSTWVEAAKDRSRFLKRSFFQQ